MLFKSFGKESAFMKNRTGRIGEALVSQGLITENQLHEALDDQKKNPRPLGQILVEKNFVDEERLSEVLAHLLEVPYVKLSEVPRDQEVLDIIPKDLIREYRILPLALNGQELTVATNDPLNVTALQEVQYKTGFFIKPVMVSYKQLNLFLDEVSSSLNIIHAVQANRTDEDSGSSIGDLVKSIINRAISERASDIHFEPAKDRLRLRFRIDGVLHEKQTIPNEVARNVISRVKIIGGMDVAESRRTQDGRISFLYNGQEYDLRVSSMPDINGENLVLRILSKAFANQSFEELGMDAFEISVVQRLILKPHGLILLTGPTGSGKTTTLYAMMNVLNTAERKLISVEDPVEYELGGITQTSVNRHIGYTFASSIRQMLRHDPDVIMVGEIRDQETAQMAIRASLTGHCVLSTIHTNSAVGAITRLVEMGVEPFMLSSALNGIIAQRLIRRVCHHCMKEIDPEPYILEEIRKHEKAERSVKIAQAQGCEKCLGSGYLGRQGVYEILEADREIRMMITKDENESRIEDHARGNGMKLLYEAGLKKVLDKMTTFEEMTRILAPG